MEALLHSIIREYTEPLTGMEFVPVEGGSCLIGCISGRPHEAPVHKVTVSQFFMAKYPVTQHQWNSIMDRNPSHFTGDNLPVEEISWYEIQEFMRRLNTMSKMGTYRLPTEAEWEYSCRAGSQSVYCFGNDLDRLSRHAWFDKNSNGHTHPVGQKKPNAWGLYDMHGNVWEWCQDWYGSYPGKELTNPTGPIRGSHRVNRGGSWSSRSIHCRSPNRNKNIPIGRYCDVGFRLVWVP